MLQKEPLKKLCSEQFIIQGICPSDSFKLVQISKFHHVSFPFSDQSFVESFASRFFFLNAICAVCNFCFCLIIGISNVDNLTIKVYDFNWKQFVQKLMIQSFKILKNHGIFLLSFQMYLNFRAKNAQFCKIDFLRDFKNSIF